MAETDESLEEVEEQQEDEEEEEAHASPGAAAEQPPPASPPPPPPPSAEQLAEAHKSAGNELYKASRYTEAAEAYGSAIAACPAVAAYHANRAAAFLMLRRFPEALADAKAAAALEPGNAKAHARCDATRPSLRPILLTPRSAGKALLSLGRTAEARASFAAAVSADPAQASAVRDDLASCAVVAACADGAEEALSGGEGGRALASAQRGLERAPASGRLHALRVRALLALGRAPEAVAAARELDCEGEGGSRAMALRGEALYRAGNMAMAQRVFEEALRRDPDASDCARGLKRVRALSAAKEAGNAAFNEGRFADAHERYGAALAVDPELRSGFTATLRVNRATAACKLGRHAEAVDDCSAALELEPENVKALLRRAAASAALGEHEAAVRDHEEAARVAPETPGVRQGLADAKRALKASKRLDYYKLLELEDRGASEAEIKKAYRRCALKFHPDKAGAGGEADRAEAERMFKLVGEANSVLSDPAKRRKYDAGLSLEEIEQGCEAGHGHGHGHGNFGGAGFGGFGGFGGMGGGMDEELLHAFFAAQQAQGGRGGGRRRG